MMRRRVANPLLFQNVHMHMGFSMIEMMIVIGIIVLLAGLTLGISNSVLRGSEIRRTKDAITLLDTALAEWETDMDRLITFAAVGSIDGGRYDIAGDGILGAPSFGGAGVSQADMYDAMNIRAKDMWAFLSESEASKNILTRIHPDLIQEDDDGLTRVVDAWQSPIGVVFPCGAYGDSGLSAFAEDACGDLTVRDEAEDGLGSCLNRKTYFVSAGPDASWGYRYQANNGPVTNDDELWADCLDNIYSYEPFIVEGSR